jgi:3-oxoacyl-[acyl-carrier protein] reductase
MELKGRVGLVTGGSRGIGRSIALLLAEKGCNVAINFRTQEDKAREVLEEVERRGVSGLLARADVSNYGEVEAMVHKVLDRLGRIDILVNNAGVMGRTVAVEQISDEEWDEVIDVNLKGAFNCCKAVVPVMKRQGGGKIINITSLAGKGGISPPHYGASKGGMIGLTFCLAQQLVKHNILVNAVAPGGIIETDMARDIPREQLDRVISLTPVGRMGRPEEVAHAVVFLAENDYVTGEVVDVNGGRYMD